MRVEKRTRDNGKSYFLGYTKVNGRRSAIYLRTPSWDCGWYWGLGYCFGGGYSHTHFDSLFPLYKDFFELETPFTEKEMWLIYELMTELYTLRKYADMMHMGGAHITDSNKALRSDALSNEHEYKRINEVLIPAVWSELKAILEP